ncbi:pilus assembly protein PilP [Herbaspirillum rhizosphaerae]|uniref:Pilus assembly protein PilP n=1 Tax=Herbaspirillum rhizosphaerae TaxID=346179 RepID=A0ABW8ZDE4_9BURK
MKRRIHCNSALRLSLTLIFVAGVSACADHETSAQLQAWINALRSNRTALPPQAVTSSTFLPLTYQADTDHTPFGRVQTIASVDANEPDTTRARPRQRGGVQALEEFPLESIQMVGTISRDGRHHALLRANGIVYMARVGDYVGKDFGMILRISDSEIELEELLPAAERRWTIRQATLALQGSGK